MDRHGRIAAPLFDLLEVDPPYLLPVLIRGDEPFQYTALCEKFLLQPNITEEFHHIVV